MSKIKYQIAPGFENLENWIRDLPVFFPHNGETIFKSRNEVKTFNVVEYQLNVKAFKVPNLINRFVYVYFRGSKAERSFNYARKFLSLGVPTPKAVAYVECLSFGLLSKSYYVSLHCMNDYTLREVLWYKVADRDEILRQWTRFTYEKLHLNNIYHLDYSPGNTLIKKINHKYEFSIVDLNRMSFRKIDFEKGLQNFRQLDTDGLTLQLLASEYATLRGQDAGKAMRILTEFDQKNKASRHRHANFKKAIKSIFKFGRAA
jgi:hypothetical protein